MINKEDLHKRICDIEPNTNNEQTYYEFIRESEEEFGMSPECLDTMNDNQLRNYLEFLDELWFK